MKKSKICFTGTDGSFTMDNPHRTSYLYFPLAGEDGLCSNVAPLLTGDAKTGQNTFLLRPVSAEELHSLRASRNFWLAFPEGDAWSATGVSAETEALIGTGREEETRLEAGFMWHRIKRNSPKYGLESTVTSFIPVEEPAVEVMEVTVRNTGGEARPFIPVAAVPIYGRSADNIRDHRHVTSLLHRIRTTDYGVYVKPELSFDERGHKENRTGYFVCGAQEGGEKPEGTYPVAADFLGEGGSFTRPRAVYERTAPVPPGTVAAGYEAMGGLRFAETSLKPGESRTYAVFLGVTEAGLEKVDRIAREFADGARRRNAFERTRQYWLEKVNVKYETGNGKFDNLMRWVGFQPILRRIFGCSFLPHHDYGKGGRGWRDLWQDCLALLIMEPGEVRGMLTDNFAGVRADGTNATIIGAGRRAFVADRNNIARVWMDHGLWPLMTTEFYIHQTGDLDILLEECPYFKDGQAARGTKKDGEWEESQGVWQLTADGNLYSGTVLEHIILQHVTVFFDVGEHNHMLLRGADWNDALDMASHRGESVAFSAAYAGNLETLSGLCLELAGRGAQEVCLMGELCVLLELPREDYGSVSAKRGALASFGESVRHTVSGGKRRFSTRALAERLHGMAEWLKGHIRQTEWLETETGGFYNGYYDDNGRRVEGQTKSGVRQMLTSQVFAVMSGVATKEQTARIAESVDRNLYDASVGGYRLNTDFGELKTDLGRMFGFAYGHKENGAVFSHMAVMYAFALYRRGFAREGWRVIRTLCGHALNFEKSRIYPGIPEYFNDRGRGMYHYLTGAASWLMLTAVTQMFGVRGETGSLVFEPKLLPEQFSDSGRASLELDFAGKHLRVVYILSRPAGDGASYRKTGLYVDGKKADCFSLDRTVLDRLCAFGRHEILVELEPAESASGEQGRKNDCAACAETGTK